jgi:hypothetical protein
LTFTIFQNGAKLRVKPYTALVAARQSLSLLKQGLLIAAEEIQMTSAP